MTLRTHGNRPMIEARQGVGHTIGVGNIKGDGLVGDRGHTPSTCIKHSALTKSRHSDSGITSAHPHRLYRRVTTGKEYIIPTYRVYYNSGWSGHGTIHGTVPNWYLYRRLDTSNVRIRISKATELSRCGSELLHDLNNLLARTTAN